jgi:branched-chain amino acid transport system ATP-binding protein
LGQIWFDGRRIDNLDPHRIVGTGIAHVPEGRRIFPEMTVYENLRLGAYLRKDRRGIAQDVSASYERFPILGARRGISAGTLSGGEQQMLAIARALMARPRLLLMDEPSVGLSPLMTAEISRTIRSISEQLGVTVLLVEQNARLALQLASFAYVLQTGSVVRKGRSEELANDEELKKAYLGI